MSEKSYHDILKHKVTSSGVLFCLNSPKPPNIHFTVILNQEKQWILLFFIM